MIVCAINSILPAGSILPEEALGISVAVISFILYLIVSKNKIIHAQLLKRYGNTQSLVYSVLFQKFSGFFFLGLIPLFVVLLSPYSLTAYGILPTNLTQSFYWIASLGSAVILLSLFISKNPNNYKNYPQIRLKNWNIRTVLINSVSWAMYLLGYEFLFRGLLLFSCLHTMDTSIAIVINVVLYSIAHIPKGIMETLGSVPIGTLFCIITINTENIWSVFLLHVIMALSNDYISLYHNPEMHFIKSK